MMIGDHVSSEVLHQFKQKDPDRFVDDRRSFYTDVSAACAHDARLILTIDEGACHLQAIGHR
ncbi:hypothetical protein ACEQPO_16585 [Bacillus sp. SL00103]